MRSAYHPYIVCLLRLLAPLACVPACARACSPCLRACVRPCSLCLPVCAPADAWSTVDFLVRRPCSLALAVPAAAWPCSLRSLSVLFAPLTVPAARRARLPAPVRARACGRARARARSARPLCVAALPSICFRAHVFQPLAAVSVSRAYNGSFYSPIW